MSLIVALALLTWSSFVTVDYDIQCRQVPLGSAYVVEYVLDPDEVVYEDEVIEMLDLAVLVSFDESSVIGISLAGCRQ